MKEYHSILTIHGLPSMDKKTIKRLVSWLNKTAKEIEEEDKNIYNRVFRARLMK